tara:strand:- start:827 stop:1300 length:474 start_codon:yes stop_codon:yes gene_type:complete
VKLYKVKKSNIDKRGLYASKNIKAGEKIIEYKGKLISKKESQQNSKFDNSKDIYLFNINEKWDLDGAWSFNAARLINHSCNPNCEVEGKGVRLWIVALKNIRKGKELSYDYGFSYCKEDLNNFICNCGEKNCCGYIVREESRWRINKKFKKGFRINN